MYQRQVSFTEAIQMAFNKYCCFTGRASRSEYWWWVLFTFLVGVVLNILNFAVGGIQGNSVITFISWIVNLALLLPGLGLFFRRLHDTGRSGWNILWSLLPLAGAIVLIVFVCQASEPEDNEYGPVPNLVD